MQPVTSRLLLVRSDMGVEFSIPFFGGIYEKD